MSNYATLTGPPIFLHAVIQTIIEDTKDGTPYYGIVTRVGSTSKGHREHTAVDEVGLHLIDNATEEHAKEIINQALDSIAEDKGLQDERGHTEISFDL